MDLDLLSYIIGVVGLGGVVFTIYNYFRNPQITLEKSDAIVEVRLRNLEADVEKVLENHLPYLDSKINMIQQQLADVDKSIVCLRTIIDERIPKKQ